MGIGNQQYAHSRIKQPSTDSVESPGGDREGKAERKTDEHKLIEVGDGRDGIGDLGAGKGEVEKHDGSNELS